MRQLLKFLLIMLSFLAGVGGDIYAQKQGMARIDSMLQALPKQKEDTNKVNLLNDLAHDYHSINPDDGIKYARQALDLATKLDWEKGIGNANNYIGVNYQFKTDCSKALEYYLKALQISRETGDKNGIAIVTGNIGNVYNQLCDYPKALEYYLNALKIEEEIANKKGMTSTIANIGTVYQAQSDYPKALEYYLKALKMYEDAGNKNGIAVVTGNIGKIYYYKHDYPKALEYDFKQLKIDIELGDSSGIANITGDIGSTYASMHNYVTAIAYEQRSLKMANEIGDEHLSASVLEYLGFACLSLVTDTLANASVDVKNSMLPESVSVTIPSGKTAQLHQAIDYLQRCLEISKKIQAPDVMKDCYEDLTEVYKLTGDYKKAIECSNNFIAIKDSLFSKENDEKILKMSMKYEYDQKAAEASKQAALKLQRQQSYTYMGIAGVLLLLIFTFFITRNNKLLTKEKQRSETLLKRSDSLLLNILPEEVADELKANGSSAAKYFDNVTVLFTDFVNFTLAGERMSPQFLVDELHECFKAFDAITDKYNIEKIKTIGDAYLAVAGLPVADPQHAVHIVQAAIEIRSFMHDRLAKLGNNTFDIRIGIHSGNVVAGIVGVKKFAYDIWGDTVNTAARMEQNSLPGKINISQTTYELIKEKFPCEYRGEIEAKNKGHLKMYFVG